MAYYEQEPPEEKPPGCLDALLITRAVFGVLVWPLAALLGAVLDIVLMFYAYTVHPALVLLPLAATAVAVWLYARWEQRRFRPPGV